MTQKQKNCKKKMQNNKFSYSYSKVPNQIEFVTTHVLHCKLWKTMQNVPKFLAVIIINNKLLLLLTKMRFFLHKSLTKSKQKNFFYYTYNICSPALIVAPEY